MKSYFACSDQVTKILISILTVLCVASGWGTDELDSATTPTESELTAHWALGDEYIRIQVAVPGLYRCYFRDLFAAGMPQTVNPQRLALRNEGAVVPLMVHLKNTAHIADEDYIEFVGDYARGTFSSFKPDNYYNIYFLSWADDRPLRYKVEKLASASIPSDDLSFWEILHLEEDNYYRESRLPRGITDNFYWCHVTAGDPRIFPIRIDFPDFDRRHASHVRLVFRLFGYSDVPNLHPAHKFEIQYGDDEEPESPRYGLGTFEFDHRGYYDYETSLPANLIRFRQRIIFKTPPDRQNVVDSISFDWIRAYYPRKLDAGKRNWFVFNSNLCTPSKPPYTFAVRNVVRGSRVFCPSQAVAYEAASANEIVVRAFDRETTFCLVSENGILSVESLEYKRRPRLAEALTTGLESLVLYDPELVEAVGVYTRYRETTGPPSAAIDASDVFDVLNDGFNSDIALKRFIRFAAARCPSLRYLVLFGDSTQDYRLGLAENFDRTDPPRVGLPIHWIESPGTLRTGGYVDDNWYASFKSANTPDLATGRIPAANVSQAFEYVRKLIEYETFGASRSDGMLVISSVEARFQDMAAEVQRSFRDCFTTVTLLFPETAVATREVQRLREAIDSGIQLLYYIGHGGAFVWRVGPVDYSQQKDLFTPTDVAQLKNALHYPIIIASSCYTTAFDAEYSIGEAFLLQPRAGAIAVIGSPWKSSVYEDHAFNARLLQNYCSEAHLRLGDVYQQTKNAQRPLDDSYVDVQTFTLLGDPTLKLVPRQ
ncbi:MAG: C25 family cysteine peptidase [Candidatus Sumerlaeaceae bacterium]|nr:C25 family cysteine peptidase [Candidatus Sumerlaeaceae bacterium]